MQTIFEAPVLLQLCFAVLVKRLGGFVEITQEDIDAVSYNLLNEYYGDDGPIRFSLEERMKCS